MNLNIANMREYAEFLEENSNRIIALCNSLEINLMDAIQYMDQASSLYAVKRMTQNIENIKNSVPINDDACKRLILALKRVQDAQNVFGRGR